MSLRSAEDIVDKAVERLKARRLEIGMSHEKLASAAGLNRSAISLIESRKRQPTLLTCIKIAKALGVRLEMLLDGLE